MRTQLPLCIQNSFLNTIKGELSHPTDGSLTLTYSEHGYRFGISAHLDGRIEIAYATYCDSPMKVETISDLFDAENAQTISQKFTEWAKFWNERLNPTKEEPKTEQRDIITKSYNPEEPKMSETEAKEDLESFGRDLWHASLSFAEWLVADEDESYADDIVDRMEEYKFNIENYETTLDKKSLNLQKPLDIVRDAVKCADLSKAKKRFVLKLVKKAMKNPRGLQTLHI